MNRRGFFKSLALLAGAASVSPQIFIPKFEPVRWKVIQPYDNKGWFISQFVYAVNPWHPAESEIIFHVREQTPEDTTVCVLPSWESDFMPELVSKDPSYWRSLGLDQ
jgi:hypothetical protein